MTDTEKTEKNEAPNTQEAAAAALDATNAETLSPMLAEALVAGVEAMRNRGITSAAQGQQFLEQAGSIDIDDATALRFGLKDGDPVEVRSDGGNYTKLYYDAATKKATAATEAADLTPEQVLLHYYAVNKARCDEWMRHHPPHVKFPLVEDGHGPLKWLNRATRRKLLKKAKQKRV